MDNYSIPNKSYDLHYLPSPSTDQNEQSTTGTPVYSTISDDPFTFCRSNSEVSILSDCYDENNLSETSSPLRWPSSKSLSCNMAVLSRSSMNKHSGVEDDDDDDQEVIDADMELMKEKFSKLLLGEDMSGSGKGVCTAVAVSNAMTNLYATVFGQNLRLEPLPPEKKSMWRREMNCLLSICDFMVEFVPSTEIYPNGEADELTISRPRTDICMNLPALQKLDTMLMEILDCFQDQEFKYVEQGKLSANEINSASFRRIIHRQEDKWWLPVPCIPSRGLSEESRKQLQHKRDSTFQIHKAAKAINNTILAEMQVPDTYLETLPKSGRTSVGDEIYRYMNTTDKFSPDYLLDCLNISSEHEALEIADRVEASMYTWRRKVCMSYSKPYLEMFKDIRADGDKNYTLATRAESLLLCLKQRFPVLSQTTLDTSKLQYNRDVGQAILESYSRVLEGLAFNMVTWIEDVLSADRLMKNQDQRKHEGIQL